MAESVWIGVGIDREDKRQGNRRWGEWSGGKHAGREWSGRYREVEKAGWERTGSRGIVWQGHRRRV